VPRPVKELKGFTKLYLTPGEEKRASITLDFRAFAYYNVAGKQWRVEPGTFNILVGSSSEQMELTGKISLDEADTKKLADRMETSLELQK
jgi:beta-glucosidase